MIKRILILAVVRLLSAALSVGAASVTPSSAAGYIFTTPLFPGSIRGEVMGNPPAYYDVRCEDIDWLFEAYTERLSLIYGIMPYQQTHLDPSFGKWPLAATNNFFQWTTAVDAAGDKNVVVGYSLVTNAPQFSSIQDIYSAYGQMADTFRRDKLAYDIGNNSYRQRYIDSDAELSGSARAAYDFSSPNYFTNVTFSVVLTNSLVTNATYILMPMTNGTTSVFTNRWTAEFEYVSTNAVTNVVEACPLDYCHVSEGQFPCCPGLIELETALIRPRRDGVTAQMYDALRSAVRLAEESAPTNVAPGIIKYHLFEYNEVGFSTNGTSTVVDTNEHYNAYYSLSGEHPKHYSWNTETREYEVFYDIDTYEQRTPAYQAIVPTRFSSDIVSTGGTERVEIEAAFAVVKFMYTLQHQEGGRTNLHLVTDSFIYKITVVPITFKKELDLSEPVARAFVTLNSISLCAESAAANSVNFPQNPSGYTSDYGVYEYWSADCTKVVIIYRTHPSSKFSSW
jgi:hypothetical protein